MTRIMVIFIITWKTQVLEIIQVLQIKYTLITTQNIQSLGTDKTLHLES